MATERIHTSIAALADIPAGTPDTVLAAGIDASETAVVVATLPTGVSAGAGEQFRIRIDGELLLVTNVAGTGNLTWTVTRAIEASTAAAHDSGAGVYLVMTGSGMHTLALTGAPTAGRLLASHIYAPATTQTYSITSTSYADVDATNLAITFTPLTTTAFILFNGGFLDTSAGTAGFAAYFNLRLAAADVANTDNICLYRLANVGVKPAWRFPLTGLTPGTPVTYKLGVKVDTGVTARLFVESDLYGSAILTAISG